MYRRKFLQNKSNAASTSSSRASSSLAQPPKSPEKENEIQSSQELTQNKTQGSTRNRFISQRQALLKLNASQHQQGKGPLEIILYNCGLEVTEIGCELQQGDPISFTRRLRVLLTSKPDYPQNAQSYIDEFKRDFILTNSEKLIKCEKYMRGILMGDGSKQHQTQTSLIMCLLAINCFKDEIVKILLERLKEYVLAKADKAEPMYISLVFAQFKFSDQILSEEVYNCMFEEFFNILKELKTFECQEVIVQQFSELEISKQEEAARRLVAMFQSKKEELLRFLDVFCLMAIDDRTIGEIFEIIQRYIKRDCSSSQYLSMIKYSIHYSRTIGDVVDTLRDQVKFESCSKDVIKSIFKIIGKSLIRDGNKTIEAWIKVISDIQNSDDIRHIDLVMLLLIADTNTETQLNAVKKIVLDKIAKGLFTDEYLKKSFATFSSIIPNISQTLLELLDGLQKIKDNQTYNFLAACYKLMFRVSGDGKAIIGSLANFLCEKRSNLPFASSSDFKMTILTILHEVMNDSPKSAAELVYNHKILLRTLDISRVELTVNEHRSLMKLLSSLIYNVDYSRALKPTEIRVLEEVKETLAEHLNMVNSKYINNPEAKIRRLGIIGAVKVVSSLVFDKIEDSSISPDDVIKPEDMEKGNVLDAVKLIEIILSAADDNYEMLAMFYDELSVEFKSNSYRLRTISQIFVNWLGDKIFNILNELINTEVDMTKLSDYTFTSHFENVDDSFEEPELQVQMGTMLFSGKMEIITLPSVFKLSLLTMLYRYDNQTAVQSLSGLCAMAVTLPEKFASPEDELSEKVEEAKLQLDLYFYCCNWFRELISGFIKSPEASILKLCKSRLKQLIKIERHLNRLLKKLPSGYIPPLVNENMRKTFENLTKEKIVQRPPKARKKEVTQPKDFKIKSNQFCREMDNEIVHLLKEKFLLNTISTQDEQFTLTELIYILEDVHQKIKLLFKAKNSEQKIFVNEILAIKDLGTSVLPHLTRVFEDLNEEIKNVMEVDETDNVGLSKVSKYSSKGFCMILEMFSMIFSYKKLKNEDTILIPLLKVLLVTDNNLRTQDAICAAIIERYAKFSDNVLNLNSAIALIDFISIIAAQSTNRDKYKRQIFELAEHFLRQEWKEMGTGSAFNTNVEKLVSIYVTKASNIDELAELVNEIENLCKENSSVFPCINKSNFICIIRNYLRRSMDIITNIKANQMSFTFWETCAKIQFKFVEAVKWQKSTVAMNLFLKNFVVFLKRFNTNGILILKAMAKKDQNKCVVLLKSIQRIRRSAHGTVCELKHRKNVGISKILPTVRQQLEIFYQEAGSVILSEDIPMHTEGALRNFDLNSVDIFSQNTTAESQIESDKDSDDDISDKVNTDTSSDDSDQDNGVANTPRSRSTIL